MSTPIRKPRMHTAGFYVQLEPVFGHMTDPATGERTITGVKAVGLTMNRPGKPKGGTVSVRLELAAPESYFLPLKPAAVVVLPEDLAVLTTPVEVDAIDDYGPDGQASHPTLHDDLGTEPA